MKRAPSLPMLLLLSLLVFIYHFSLGIYYVFSLEPSPTLEFLYTGAFLCGVVWWLQADTQRSSLKHVYCLGLIVGYGWIVIIPYHLLKTRGLKGLIPLLALIGSLLAAYLCAVIVYMIFAA
jgi:hypothetical protein